jgi:hypothetical protein
VGKRILGSRYNTAASVEIFF